MLTPPNSPLRHTLIALSIAPAFAFAPHAFAQDADKTLPEVVVTAPAAAVERATTASVGGFSEAPLLQTPASVSVITNQQMQDQRIRQTSDVVKFDASLNDAYNAIGYAEQLSIRGYALDNFASYRKDGLAISSDASIPLENKERIEVLKGLAGLQAGIATPGGIVNYVTKRPTNTPLRSVTVEASERGTLFGSVDLGGRFEDERFGYRINAATEKLRSYVKGADGERQFVSGAFDWRLTPRALLQLDLDYQHKSQVTAAGYQLIGGTALPRGVSAKTNLNDQPWTKPVVTDSGNVGLRFEYQLDANWKTSLAANWHKTQRDDFAAFPWGCDGEGGIYPGFCSDGTFNVYDYQSENESKSIFTTQAMMQGRFATGTVQHDLTFGASTTRRRDNFGDCVYGTDDCFGTTRNGPSNMYNPISVPASTISTGPIRLRRSDLERSIFAQDVLSLSNTLKFHAGLRYTEIERDQFDAFGVQESYNNGYVLPNAALVFSPQSNWSVYGSYSEGLEHGGTAALTDINSAIGEPTVLNPSRSKQFELGFKADLHRDLNVAATLFQIEKPHEYSKFAGIDPVWLSNTFEYVRGGDAVHRGLELSAQGRATRNLSVGASLLALHTETKDTGDGAIEGKRVGNVPNFKSSVYFDYTLDDISGLSLNGSWQHTGSKTFSPNSLTRAKVPDYDIFNLGARYATRIAGQATTLRFNIDNVFDKFYWRDASHLLGGYLLPGAPRTFKVSATFDF